MSTALQPPEGRISDFDAGVFLVDKPIGPTSFKIVQLVRSSESWNKKGGACRNVRPFCHRVACDMCRAARHQDNFPSDGWREGI